MNDQNMACVEKGEPKTEQGRPSLQAKPLPKRRVLNTCRLPSNCK